MIKTVAELLKAFSDAERAKLDAEELTHGPTIGSMYEGLTKEIVDRSIPAELGLRVLPGFACFDGQLSGELDCMLVRGEGEQIPYTGKYKWHIKDVIAVFEVKKTLTAEDLADSYNHLRDVSILYSKYMESDDAKGVGFNIRWPRKAFSQITGVAAPEHSKVEELPFDLEMIYHTLINEFFGPIRIVVGHHGWKKEKTLRDHIAKMLEDRLDNPAGMGVGSFPQLIIGGEFSLVKANGFPYTPSMIKGMWPFLLSTSHNPLRVLLELIFTKIDVLYGTTLIEDDSVEHEAMSPCLRARAVEQGERKGWEYMYDEISGKTLKERGASYVWAPAELTSAQFTIINRLCRGDSIMIDDPDLIKFVSTEPDGIDGFVRSLLATQMVATKGKELILTTIECLALITPQGKFVAGENNAGQMHYWLEHETGKPLDQWKTLVIRTAGDKND